MSTDDPKLPAEIEVEPPIEEPKKKVYSPGFIAAQFKPGQSGNPKGRPKQESLETLLRRYLQQPIADGEGTTRMEALVKIIFSEGVAKRNSSVLIAIMDRLYPKPLTVKLSGNRDDPPEIIVTPTAEFAHKVRDVMEEVGALETGKTNGKAPSEVVN